MKEIRFTKHASEKLATLERYGFKVSMDDIIDIVSKPSMLDRVGEQFYSTKAINEKYALRVVYEEGKDIIRIITFYPVRRERYGV